MLTHQPSDRSDLPGSVTLVRRELHIWFEPELRLATAACPSREPAARSDRALLSGGRLGPSVSQKEARSALTHAERIAAAANAVLAAP